MNEQARKQDEIYIYSTDTYGNPGPYYTTADDLLADMREIGYTGSIREKAGGLYDDGGERVAVCSDKADEFISIDDPSNLVS